MSQYQKGFLSCVLVMITFLLFLNASSQYGWWTDERSPANKLFVRLDGSNMHLAGDWIHPGTITSENIVVNNVAQAKVLHVTPTLSASEQSTLAAERPNGAIFQAGSSGLVLGHIETDGDGIPWFYEWSIADATTSQSAMDRFKVTIVDLSGAEAGIPLSVRMLQ